jgi:NAD(P)-dependent dehydrogenase (short-subunit alcohol dehydrogenase family)
MTSPARITTSFGRGSTAEEVLEGVDLSGGRAIVTGATSGIGTETARVLAGAGAEVTLAIRNLEAGRQVAAEIAPKSGAGSVRIAHLDIGDRASIDAFVTGWTGPLHMLVNNAGVMAMPSRELTTEGYEYHFGANHLGHMALSLGLYVALASAEGARVVTVSSDAHAHGNGGAVDFDDIHFEHRPYVGGRAYAQSKTANILFAVALNRRWSLDGVTANALHPGAIKSGLQKHIKAQRTQEQQDQVLGNIPWRSTEQGAATSVLLAASPEVEGIGGRYFENCNEAIPFDPDTPPVEFDAPGVAAYAIDPDIAERLWAVSLRMLVR